MFRKCLSKRRRFVSLNFSCCGNIRQFHWFDAFNELLTDEGNRQCGINFVVFNWFQTLFTKSGCVYCMLTCHFLSGLLHHVSCCLFMLAVVVIRGLKIRLHIFGYHPLSSIILASSWTTNREDSLSVTAVDRRFLVGSFYPTSVRAASSCLLSLILNP